VVFGAGAAGVVDAVVDGGGKFEFFPHNFFSHQKKTNL